MYTVILCPRYLLLVHMQTRNLLNSLRARLPSLRTVSTQATGGITTKSVNSDKHHNDEQHELFRYTSGRWIFNEHLRLSERQLEFDVSALRSIVASSSGQAITDIVDFSKLSEGGYNRVFQARFKDGQCVIARLPYPSTTPEHYAVASEVATLDYLRLHGIRTPKVYAWCSTKSNTVGSEYIIMEKLDGIPLGEIWYSMTPKEQHGMMKQIVHWEAQLMSLSFPAYGSIYYRKDLTSEKKISLPGQHDEFCMGPIAHYSWWHDRRNVLDVDAVHIFRAVGERELSWTKLYAKPRLPYERLYREIYKFRKVSPDTHIRNLLDYLRLAPFLGFGAGTALHRPVIRHPDFQPNNILVSNSNEIVGFIDWQHSSILPLGLAAGIPQHFQNYGDPLSDELRQPPLELPSNFDSLSPSEQASVRLTHHKRLVHFFYAAFTMRLNEVHYDAIFDNSAILRQGLFKSAGTPWEGDSITLKTDMIRAIQSWGDVIASGSVQPNGGAPSSPPIQYSDEVVRETLDLHSQQEEADIAMEQMRHALDVDVMGWVSNSEYEAAKELAGELKARMLEAAETAEDITGVRDHFPFDDFDESVSP